MKLMNFIKKIIKGFLFIIVAIYVLFLVLPFAANPFLGKYSEQISKMAEESTGLKIKIEKLGIVTTPKLTIGIKIGHIKGALPNGDEFLDAEGLQAKLSVIPLFAGKIKADVFSIKEIDTALRIKPDGSLQIVDFLPEANEDENTEQLTSLPLGLKLSNSMPNIYVEEYSMTVIDMRDNREYTLQGGNLKITNFVLNKKVKFSTAGIATLDGEKSLSYDIKIYNHIMPDIDINDLIFANNSSAQSEEKKTGNSEIPFNITDILKSIKKNGLTADSKLDIETKGTLDDVKINGLIDVSKLSILVNGTRLPDGHVTLKLKDKKINTDIKLFTAKDETTSVIGEIIHGKNPEFNMSVNSNTTVHNLFELIKSIAASVNYNDLASLDGSGNIDAAFNIKANLKRIVSNGYIKIPQASVKYGLYNILIDNINADVDLKNNNINFKNVGFNILSQPLKLYGTLSENAIADLHLTADKLPVKGVLTAAGQLNLLKENDIKSGTISADASIKGHLSKIEPAVDVDLKNLNILNKPSATTIKLAESNINLTTDGKSYNGKIKANSMSVDNPSAKFTLPQIGVILDNKDIKISDTYLLVNSSKIDISGKIADYTTKNMAMDIKAKGSVFANDIIKMLPSETGSMLSGKGALHLLVTVTGNDKTQMINAQALATPSGYLKITDLQAVSGKSSLINSKINIAGNSLTLENTGLFSSGLKSLSDNPASNISGTPVIKVSGGISDLSKLTLKNLNIATVGTQSISVPGFNNSKAAIAADITLNGNAAAPDYKGSISCPEIVLPTLKTDMKNVTVDLGKIINANLPLINIDNSVMNIKATVSPNFNNGIIIKNMDYNANMFDADRLPAALASLTTSGSSGSSGGGSQDLGIVIQNGKGTITKFKTGKIIATSLTSDFNLKNNVFSLKNLTGDAFSGKINGHITCNILNGYTTVDMTGTGMKAVDAIDAAAGIPNALSGTLNFGAKLTLNAYETTYNAMLKTVKGTADFNIKNGNYLNIGTIDQFVLAGNVTSNLIIKTALLPIKKMPVVQNSTAFNELKGDIKLSNGIATLAPVTSAGPTIAYFVTGKYDLLTGYTNVIILGRMGADVVAALGPLGQLSVSKLTAYLPKFGANTLNLLSSLTSDPAQEKISQIPALSTGATNYKDFKVIFNGNIMSAASVKSFKWLSACDTSEIVNGSMKDQLKTGINAIKQTGQNNINDARKIVTDTKTTVKTTTDDIKNQVQKTKDSIQELKNLKNMFKTNSSQTSGTTGTNTSTTTETAPATTTEPAN